MSTGLSVQEKLKIDFQDGGHLGFLIGKFSAISIHKSPPCFLPSFKSFGLFDSGEEAKNRFSRWLPHHSGHLGFLIRTILAIFYLQVNPMLPTELQVNWPSLQEKKPNIDFQNGHHGGYLGFPIKKILAVSDQ